MADDLRRSNVAALHQPSYKVAFVRHGGPEHLTFTCRTDAALFAWWLDYAGAGISAEIIEEKS